MKKQFLRHLSCLLTAALLAVFLPAFTAFAKSEDFTVDVPENASDYIFDIVWDNAGAAADVSLKAPDGTVYNTQNMPEADVGDGELLFYFEAPAAGSWVVTVTGEGLGDVSINAGRQPGSMQITSFTLTVADGQAQAAWSVADSEPQLNFELFATTDPANLGGVSLGTVSGDAAGSGTFSLGGLDSGDYYFYLKATGTDGIFSTRYADGGSFSWRAAGALPALQGVQARMLDDELWLTWQPSEDADTYRVMAYDADTGAVLYDETVDGDSQWSADISTDVQHIQAAVAAVSSGTTGNFTRVDVTRSAFDGVSVTFPPEGQINTRAITVQVAFSGSYTVSAALNGETLCEGSQKSGDYRVEMEDGDNRVSFYITDGAGNIRTFGADYHVDTAPPALSVVNDLDGTSTGEGHVWLSGLTEGGAVLRMNGREVDTQNGYFNIRCPLHFGKNTLTLTATDGAGNEAQYTAVVRRPLLGAAALRWGVCIAAFAALSAVYLTIFIRGRKKNREKEQGK